MFKSSLMIVLDKFENPSLGSLDYFTYLISVSQKCYMLV